jgi:hypothetical protein
MEGIRELETPALIDAINTGGKHRSTCPRQPLVANWSFAVELPNGQSIAESALAVIRSSSGTATVHTGERRRCFQIPDSLYICMTSDVAFRASASTMRYGIRAQFAGFIAGDISIGCS